MKLIQNPPPPEIGPKSSSDAVANLQDALLFLIENKGILLPDPQGIMVKELRGDRDRQVYSTGTGNVIAAFRQLKLSGSEMVDEATAKELNRLLQKLGAFDTPLAEWVVCEQVGCERPAD